MVFVSRMARLVQATDTASGGHPSLQRPVIQTGVHRLHSVLPRVIIPAAWERLIFTRGNLMLPRQAQVCAFCRTIGEALQRAAVPAGNSEEDQTLSFHHEIKYDYGLFYVP